MTGMSRHQLPAGGAVRYRLEVRLSAADAGSRVVIRWRRPAGDADEIADVLGVLTAADDASFTVRKASGELSRFRMTACWPARPCRRAAPQPGGRNPAPGSYPRLFGKGALPASGRRGPRPGSLVADPQVPGVQAICNLAGHAGRCQNSEEGNLVMTSVVYPPATRDRRPAP